MALRPRIGLAVHGDGRDPAWWSGTPFALAGALARGGADVVPLRAGLPLPAENVLAAALSLRTPPGATRPGWPESRMAARFSPAMTTVRSLAVAAAVRRARPLDGVIQISTEYRLPSGVPYLVFDDMTVVQAVRHGYPYWRGLPDGDVRRRVRLEAEVFARARVLCFMSSWAARSASEDHGVTPERIRVVGVGSNQPVRAVERDWAVPRFLFVGRDWRRKNGPAVLEAFGRLRSERPDVHLDVIGAHPPLDAPGVTGHGPLPLGEPGARRRLMDLFDRATCLVVPSLLEPVGIVYAEALAAGLPSIGTSVGGAADVIGDAGVTVDPADGWELLAAMRRLCDPRVARACGMRARARAAAHTWDAVGERVTAAFMSSMSVGLPR